MILIDTGPLVALCDARDGKHQAALKHLERLAEDQLAVCEAVLTEACFHLDAPSQRQRLRAILHELDVQPLPVTSGRVFWLEAFDWMAKYADQQPDWADACLAILCGQDEQLKVWTYDREFRTTWRRPDGTAIPMAVRLS